MDPTQVDARYQIQFLPAPGPNIDNFPVHTGPYTAPTWYLDNDAGLAIDTAVLISTLLASLTQQGVIGTRGGQQLQGDFFLVGPGGAVFPPPWSPDLWAVTLQNGGLAFYNDSEGVISAPNAFINWFLGSPAPRLEIGTTGNLEIHGAPTAGQTVFMVNDNSGSTIQLTDSPGAPGDIGAFLFDSNTVNITGGAVGLWIGLDFFGNNNTCSLLGTSPYYSCDNQNGLTGTSVVQDTYTGGLITTFGPGTGGTIGQPTILGVPPELLYTDLSGNLANTPGITTDGADNLMVLGTVYTPSVNSGAAQLTLVTTGFDVEVQSEALFDFDQISVPGIAGGFIKTRWNPTTPVCMLSSDNTIAWDISTDIGTDLTGDLALARVGGSTLGITNGLGHSFAEIGILGAILCPDIGNTFSIFGATPTAQYNTPGQTLGFTPNTSAHPVFNESTWDGNLGGSAFTIDDIVRALKLFGFFIP